MLTLGLRLGALRLSLLGPYLLLWSPGAHLLWLVCLWLARVMRFIRRFRGARPMRVMLFHFMT